MDRHYDLNKLMKAAKSNMFVSIHDKEKRSAKQSALKKMKHEKGKKC